MGERFHDELHDFGALLIPEETVNNLISYWGLHGSRQF